MASNNPKPDILSRAIRVCSELGHNQIRSEHYLLALVGTESASSQALRACGVSREAVLEAISCLPEAYHKSAQASTKPSGTSVMVDIETRAIYGRAEGLAAGLGSLNVRDEHMLLALLWERNSVLATRFIEELGATGEQIIAELRRRGIKVPKVPPPTRPKWGPFFYVSREEFERLAADLRRRGVLYRFNYREGDQVIISIDEQDEKS